VPQLQKS
jgi:hypothetical protein